MGIDIDSYINEMLKQQKDEEKQTTQKEENKEEKVNLDFDETIKENLSKVNTQSTTNSDVSKLHEIYEEIKQFDQSLPSKFLSVEDLSNNSLEMIGKHYSNEYLHQIQNFSNSINENIDKRIQLITQDIIDKNFTRIPYIQKELRDISKTIPGNLEILKVEVDRKIKEKEIEVIDAIEKFKEKELPNIRKQLYSEINTLLSNLKPNNTQFIKEQISHLQHVFQSIPALFRVTLTKEQLVVDKALLKAQKYLEKELHTLQETKSKNIIELEEELNTAVLNKNLEKALTYYNQIIYEFSKIPDYPFDKKMDLLERIFSSHKKIHKLYINNNVTLFLETYNNSKVIEDVKEYLEKATHSPHQIKIENLELLKHKINSIPNQFKEQKESLLQQLKQQYNYNKTQENTSSMNNASSKTTTSHDSNYPKKKTNPYSKDNNSTLHKKILHEIDELYKNFKKAPNKEKAKIYYDKIHFYLGFANLSHERIDEIKHQLDQLWYNKK